MVGVLVFVHQQVAGAVADPLPDVGVVGEELDREADEVVEVDAGGLGEEPLVAPVERGDLLLEEVGGRRLVGGRLDELVLPPLIWERTERGEKAVSDSPSEASAALTRLSWSDVSRMAKSRRRPTRSP